MWCAKSITPGFHPRPHQVTEYPGPAPGDIAPLEETNSLRLPRWGLRKLDGFWPKKAGKIPEGKARFSLGIIPRLSPDALHPGWRLRRRARSTTRPIQSSAFLHAPAGTKIVFPIKQHPLLRVQGGHRPGAGFRGRTGPCFVTLHNIAGKKTLRRAAPAFPLSD